MVQLINQIDYLGGNMKFLIALWVGKFINVLINIIDKTRGSNFSGEKALKIDPQMIKHFKGIDYEKVVFITGSNGKSTTTSLINHALKTNGKTITTNSEGANLIGGVATALIKNSTLTGRIKSEYCVFETDERFLPIIHEQLPAKNIVITNVQRDQSHRNGDPDFIYRTLLPVMKKDVKLFLNNDEPRVKSFGMHNPNYVTYGVSRHEESFDVNKDFATMACPYCFHDIDFKYYNNPSVGPFTCTNCGNGSEEHADYEVTDVDFENRKFKIEGIEYYMPYTIPYMLYNYSATAAVAKEMAGINSKEVAEAFKTYSIIGGRAEVLKYKDKTIKYMKFKQESPETLQTCINIMAADKTKKAVCIGLGVVTDIIPNYINTVYACECDFTQLEESGVESYYCFTENACYDAANILIYQGIDPDKITIEETEDPKTIFEQIDKINCDNIYLITLMGNFEIIQSVLHLEREA